MINNQNILAFDFYPWQMAPTCCSITSFRSEISRRNYVRISWPEGRQVSFSSSIFYCMNKFSTKCLQISASSLREDLGKVDLVLTSWSLHQETSLLPTSLRQLALSKDSMTRCLVSAYFLLIISSICRNSSSICFMMSLYSSSSTFLFFFISTSTCLILSSSSSRVLMFSSLSLAMLGMEFLLGTTRWSLWMALPQMQFTHSSLYSFSQQRVMKLLCSRHFCGIQFSKEMRYRSRQVQKLSLRDFSDSMQSAWSSCSSTEALVGEPCSRMLEYVLGEQGSGLRYLRFDMRFNFQDYNL